MFHVSTTVTSTIHAVQLFKPDTIRNFLYTKHQLGSLLIFLGQTQTDILVKDAAESVDYVAWTVVRV
jgi:hypothetical protein